jgi:hypothetical protein
MAASACHFDVMHEFEPGQLPWAHPITPTPAAPRR